MSAVVLVVELEIVEGQKERFLARARTHRKNVLKNEPGCQRFDIMVPQEGGDTVFLYEIYADQKAVETHMATSYMKEYLSDTGPMIANRTRTHCAFADA